jgi:hypothetical protein
LVVSRDRAQIDYEAGASVSGDHNVV